MIIVRNPDAIAKANSYAPGILTRDGELVGWPVGLEWPTQSEVEAWEVAHAVTFSDLEIERDRRLALASFTYDFGDVRGVHTIGTDEKDMAAWIGEVMPIAQARLALSDTTPINIFTNTGAVAVSASEWMDIINTGSSSRQAIWQYYFALSAMDSIPVDYQGDQYWSPPPDPGE